MDYTTIALQLLFNALIAGALYSLVATGYTIIQSTLKFINFQHGALTALGAYIVYQLFVVSKVLDFIPAAVVSIVSVGALGFVIERIGYKPLRRAPSMAPLMTSLGVSVAIQNVVLLIWGPLTKDYGVRLGTVVLSGVYVTMGAVYVTIISFASLGCLYFFLKRTKMGKAGRALAENMNMAIVLGVDADKVISVVFTLVSALAAMGGILIGLVITLYPSMGGPIIVKTFAATIIGGVGSIGGAIVASYLIAVVETVGVWFIAPEYRNIFAYVLLVAVLLIRPSGFFGEKQQK